MAEKDQPTKSSNPPAHKPPPDKHVPTVTHKTLQKLPKKP